MDVKFLGLKEMYCNLCDAEDFCKPWFKEIHFVLFNTPQPNEIHRKRWEYVILIKDIKAPKIKLIKIDVEAAELEVIKGAVNTIERHKPSLVIELHLPQNEKPIKEILKSIGIKVSENIWQAQKHFLYVVT